MFVDLETMNIMLRPSRGEPLKPFIQIDPNDPDLQEDDS
jgi:hypothetical protein